MGVIQLPGLFDQIQPGLQGIGSFISDLVNPDAQRQMAVRNAILAGRINPQDLNNMGAAQVEQTFGKGTGGFATGPESAQHKLQNVANDEIQRILSGGTPQEKEELLAKLTGVQTTAQRNEQTDTATIRQEQVKKIQEENQKQAAADSVARTIHARLGADPKGIDLYTASKTGKIAAPELDALLASPEYAKKYENDRSDYWHRIDVGLEQQRIAAQKEGKFNLQDYMQRVTANKAGMIAEQYSADPMATATLIQNPTLRDKYLAMSQKDVPPAEVPLWEAAQALKKHADATTSDQYMQQYRQFRLNTQKQDAVLSVNARAPDPEKQAAIREKNNVAREIFGKDAPQWKYDTNAPDNSSGLLGMGKTPTLYRVGGDPAIWGTDEPYVPTKNPLDSYRGRSKQEIDSALKNADQATRTRVIKQLTDAGIYK